MRREIRWLVAAAALLAAAGIRAADSGPEVSVTGGKIRGSVAGYGGAVFKGIPFAQPPVGDLRWREPMPVKAWADVREADKFPAPCMQGGGNSSEDCLYLNVWTAEWPAKSRKAVMVWFHGGGNFAGATNDPLFDGEPLAREGVLLVTAQYRMGVFGFFEHPELTRESGRRASGNYGLLDQIAALRWVRDNIAKFGGDPANVTIFGESAGSLDVNVLMASPLAKGLFRRVIGESGPAIDPPTLAEGEKKGEELAAKLTANGQPGIKGMRALSAADLQRATGQGLSFLGANLGVIVDGWVFPESPLKAFAEGKELKVDLLLGSNSRELQRPFFPMTGTLAQAITEQYGPLADRALELYGVKGGAEPAPDPLFGTAMAQWATDSQFRCGSVAELVWHTGAGNTGYQFQFARATPGRESAGASHGSEVPYVFGTLGRAANSPKYGEVDQQVSAAMRKYWTNFAKTGDPNGAGMPRWPEFDAKTRAYMEFTDAGPQAREGLRRQVCDLYTENLKRLMAK
ncbi:MAG TPA: carboxylesterase family protein [Bryobacteraceae bacterium]|nr:carboxylesterase family protein [Bryobacteraceae bacterium]